jgi:hypothetical protein
MRKIFFSFLIFFITAVPAIAEELRGETLQVFFRSDCAPCIQELRIIPKIAREHEDLRIVIISLDKQPVNHYIFSGFMKNVHVFKLGEKGEAMAVNTGNDKLILPFSVLLDKEGRACFRHYGLLGTQLVDEWLKSC